MVDRIVNFFTSLKLTVACLLFALVLVFTGTIAQVHEGLYQAQARFFRSWLIHSLTFGDETKIPILLPGGYLIGTVLLVNLLSAHLKRFKFTRKKTGIVLVHGGLILLLLGQLFTDMLSAESAMKITEGESKNYSEDFQASELAVIDVTDPSQNEVVAIPEHLVAKQKEIHHEKLPFTIRVKDYWQNATNITSEKQPGAIAVAATEGFGRGTFIQPSPAVLTMDERNLPSALIELAGAKEHFGTWLVSTLTKSHQSLQCNGRTYELTMRFTRYYKPFSVTLMQFRHDKYKGTEIPKNFSSRVRLERADKKEDREVLIFMNNPLRYEGETFYQAGFDEKNPNARATILQVVHNPSWLTPYLACVLVGAGLVIQFLTHLIGFAMKRKSA